MVVGACGGGEIRPSSNSPDGKKKVTLGKFAALLPRRPDDST